MRGLIKPRTIPNRPGARRKSEVGSTSCGVPKPDGLAWGSRPPGAQPPEQTLATTAPKQLFGLADRLPGHYSTRCFSGAAVSIHEDGPLSSAPVHSVGIRQPVSESNPSQSRSVRTVPSARPQSPQSAYPAARQRGQSQPAPIHEDGPLRSAPVHSVSPSRSLAVESPQLSTPRCEVLTTRPPGTTPLHTQRKTPVLGVKPHPQRQRPWA